MSKVFKIWTIQHYLAQLHAENEIWTANHHTHSPCISEEVIKIRYFLTTKAFNWPQNIQWHCKTQHSWSQCHCWWKLNRRYVRMGNIEKTSLRKSTLTRSILVEFSSTQEYIKIMTNMKTALGLALRVLSLPADITAWPGLQHCSGLIISVHNCQ